MFYGIPEEKRQAFKQAIDILKDTYPDLYAADMLICMWRNGSFRNDEQFMQSFMSTVSDSIEGSLMWRLHVLSWAAKSALNVDGDFVECGVFKGFCSTVLCKYLDFANLDRKFYLYDTFSGLPEETSTEQERINWNHYKDYDPDALFRQVTEAFSTYGNVEVIRGSVPDSFQQSCPEKIAFLHIDMNSEKAEIMALESLYDRVVPGGFIVLDDFGWTCNINQNIAERKFFDERQQQILELPTGQGVILKHA